MENYVEGLKFIINDAYAQLVELGDSYINAKPNPNKWSKKEILGHLIDSAYNNHQRFVRAEDQGNFNFLGYDPDHWVKANQYQKRSWREVIDLWKSTNLHLAQCIEMVDQEFAAKLTTNHNFHLIGMNPIDEGTQSSLSYLIWDYLFHLEHHLAQVIPNYERKNIALL